MEERYFLRLTRFSLPVYGDNILLVNKFKMQHKLLKLLRHPRAELITFSVATYDQKNSLHFLFPVSSKLFLCKDLRHIQLDYCNTLSIENVAIRLNDYDTTSKKFHHKFSLKFLLGQNI